MSKNIERMQIYTVLQQIEKLIESAPRAKLSVGNKRIMDSDQLYDLLGDLKVCIPDDVRRANSVLLEADMLISDADGRANSIIQSAERRATMILDKANAHAEQVTEEAATLFEQKVSTHAVYVEAQRRAEQVNRKTEHSANVVFEDTKRYSDEILADLLAFMNNYQSQITATRAKLNVAARNKRIETVDFENEYPSGAEETPHNLGESSVDTGDYYENDDSAPSFVRKFRSAFSNLFATDEDEVDAASEASEEV